MVDEVFERVWAAELKLMEAGDRKYFADSVYPGDMKRMFRIGWNTAMMKAAETIGHVSDGADGEYVTVADLQSAILDLTEGVFGTKGETS